MTVRPIVGPLDRGSRDRDVDELLGRVTDLERFPVGRWIYVGTYPGDPNTTPDSPAFQNSWENAGAGDGPLKFRRTNEGQTEITGSVTGGVAGTVVTTLPALYRQPAADYSADGTSDGTVAVWQLAANGELTYIGSLVTGGAGSDTTAIHYDVFNTGGSLSVQTTVGNLALDSTTGNLTLSGDFINLFSPNDIQAFPDGLFGIFAGTEIDLLADSTGWIIVPTEIKSQLDAGAKFTIYDSSNNPLLQITDGSPDIHIQAGGNVVADL